MRVTVDDELCCGYGFCTRVVPEVLMLDDRGKALVFVGEVPPEQEDLVRRAARTCPQSAIIVTDD